MHLVDVLAKHVDVPLRVDLELWWESFLYPGVSATRSLSEVDLWQWRRGAVEGATIPTGMVPAGTFLTICWTQCRDGCASDNWAWKSCETV